MINLHFNTSLGTETQKLLNACACSFEIQTSIRPGSYHKTINLLWLIYKIAGRQRGEKPLSFIRWLLHHLHSYHNSEKFYTSSLNCSTGPDIHQWRVPSSHWGY